jgi:flagellar biosynthesis component FlhA
MFIVHPGTWIAMMVIVIVIYLGLAVVPGGATRGPPADARFWRPAC